MVCTVDDDFVCFYRLSRVLRVHIFRLKPNYVKTYLNKPPTVLRARFTSRYQKYFRSSMETQCSANSVNTLGVLWRWSKLQFTPISFSRTLFVATAIYRSYFLIEFGDSTDRRLLRYSATRDYHDAVTALVIRCFAYSCDEHWKKKKWYSPVAAFVIKFAF